MTSTSKPAKKPLRGMALMRHLRAQQGQAAQPKPLRLVLAAQRAENTPSTLTDHGQPEHDGNPGNCEACHAAHFGHRAEMVGASS